jgi:hypothetical protein
MMKRNTLYVLLCVIVAVLVSCNKNGDTIAPDISDQLEKKYCNIPHAVNYNWNFPGIEDNETCFFAIDFYKGTWMYIDTIKRSDESLVRIDTLILNFQPIDSDTSYSVLNMLGWCGSERLVVRVNKFYMAQTDSFDGNLGWQKICNNQDSVHVSMRKNLFDSTQLFINITQHTDTLTLYHTGNGSRL